MDANEQANQAKVTLANWLLFCQSNNTPLPPFISQMGAAPPAAAPAAAAPAAPAAAAPVAAFPGLKSPPGTTVSNNGSPDDDKKLPATTPAPTDLAGALAAAIDVDVADDTSVSSNAAPVVTRAAAKAVPDVCRNFFGPSKRIWDRRCYVSNAKLHGAELPTVVFMRGFMVIKTSIKRPSDVKEDAIYDFGFIRSTGAEHMNAFLEVFEELFGSKVTPGNIEKAFDRFVDATFKKRGWDKIPGCASFRPAPFSTMFPVPAFTEKHTRDGFRLHVQWNHGRNDLDEHETNKQVSKMLDTKKAARADRKRRRYS